MSVSELFKDTRLPVLAAPLFIISYPELVIAQCKAGVIGSFPALNARPPGKPTFVRSFVILPAAVASAISSRFVRSSKYQNASIETQITLIKFVRNRHNPSFKNT